MARKASQLPALDFFRGFEAAARHLSFTRAAEELFLTQSAISRQIHALEERLGAKLFTRRNRGLALTEAGREMYRAADIALRTLHEAPHETNRVANVYLGGHYVHSSAWS